MSNLHHQPTMRNDTMNDDRTDKIVAAILAAARTTSAAGAAGKALPSVKFVDAYKEMLPLVAAAHKPEPQSKKP
jgi:hypothetical protein